ncbi:unnamed protein product [Darwinula stevensoni]|uniref:EB domain-containing protein n=1 Tax=Darwinula stevensoni TaxID=69355 RepID=A0A7R9A749_9CRUS|nr:unnamed protein product [Darwinula stevensoni]CAG0891510.1 unnamed protein product [Darwinula stevensoni]
MKAPSPLVALGVFLLGVFLLGETYEVVYSSCRNRNGFRLVRSILATYILASNDSRICMEVCARFPSCKAFNFQVTFALRFAIVASPLRFRRNFSAEEGDFCIKFQPEVKASVASVARLSLPSDDVMFRIQARTKTCELLEYAFCDLNGAALTRISGWTYCDVDSEPGKVAFPGLIDTTACISSGYCSASCVRHYGEFCVMPQQCQASTIGATCTIDTCTCPSAWQYFNGVCLSPDTPRRTARVAARLLGWPCNTASQCLATTNGSLCDPTSLKCVCSATYAQIDDSTCLPKVAFAGACTNDKQCSKVVDGSQCIGNACDCIATYYFDSISNKCVRITTTTTTTPPAPTP